VPGVSIKTVSPRSASRAASYFLISIAFSAKIEGVDRAAQRGAWLQPVTLESQNTMNAADGPTTEPRIRINRPDDENARYKVSRACGQPHLSRISSILVLWGLRRAAVS
jgi:hypothetical protein